MASDEQIRELAYHIWQQEGSPEGKATEHYFRAKQMLEAIESIPSIIDETKTTLPEIEMPQLSTLSKPKPTVSRKKRSKKASKDK